MGYEEFVALVSCLVLLTRSSCSLSPQEYGVVYANSKTFVFVGEGVDLYCNITNKDVRENSSRLHFERSTKKGQMIVPSEYVDVLTTRSVRLRLSNLALDDDGVYTCFQETFSGETRVLGSKAIEVDNKPQSVKEILCRVHNWNHMKCSWNLGVKFQHLEYVKVSLVWTIHGEQQDCPKLTSTSCLWDSKVYVHGYQYLMIVEVTTIVEGKELMLARSPQFKIDTLLYVEPAPVNNLQATVEGSTCVYLTWQHSSADWLKFFVAESRVKGKEKWNQIILDQEQEQEDYHSDVCNLTPFTEYEFRMSVLPFPVETSEPVVQGFKSEWKTVSAKTLQDVPQAAPEICSGCFHDYKCPHKKLQRCVRLYWQSLKENEKCGILINYNITYTSIDTGITQSLLLPVTDASSELSADLELPSPSQSFQILITPGTSEGFSRRSSSLFLQSFIKKPSAPTSFLVEWDEFDLDESIRFYLSWAALNVDLKTGMRYSNVSVVWCCGQRQQSQCESDLNWSRLPADHVTYELQPDEDSCLHSDYLVGVSAEAVHNGLVVSSGIQWSSCVYLRNQKPQNSPKNVRQSLAHPKNGLTIQWDKSKCEDEESFITEYLVIYCPLYEDDTCMESEKFLNISNSVTEVTLNHLKEEIRYKVNVIAVSSAGLGPSSPVVTHTVKGSPQPEPETDRSVGVIVGVISFMILLVIMVALWRYCFYLKKKISNTENLIQPYAQTSENYTTKKLEDIRTRPLPKTPEDQHFYGWSACMSTHGCEEANSSKHSEKCFNGSGMSQRNLLSKLIQTNHSSSTKKLRPKRNTKKDAENRSCKGKNFHSKETKALLYRNSSMSSNDSNGMKTPYPRKVLPCTLSAFKPTGNLLDAQKYAVNTFTPAWRLSECLQNAISNFSDQQEIRDPSIMNFSQTNTLSLRRLPRRDPTVTTQLQNIQPYLPSAQESHKMTLDLSLGAPCSKYIPDSSLCTWRKQQPQSSCHCLVSTAQKVQILTDYPNSVSASRCMTSDYKTQPDSRKASDYPQTKNLDISKILEIKRNSFPLESILYFPPPPASPPSPPCSQGMRLNAQHSFSNHRRGHHCDCQLRRSSRNSYPTASHAGHDTADHLQHQHLVTDIRQMTPAATRKEQGLAQPPFSPTSSPAAHLNPFLNISNKSSVDSSQYCLATSSHTFPRNTSKESNVSHLPSPISRPLSGDLLDLPPEYYQDPQLDRSNQILTEL